MATGEYGSEVYLQDNAYRYLVDHAIQHAWCNPEMDNQHIIAPCRITPFTGALNRVDVMMRTITLPTQGETYHVFQVGQLHPLVVGLMQQNPIWTQEQWIKLSDAINQCQMVADVYSENGIHIPCHEVYYMYSNDRDLIIAIKHNKFIPFNYQRHQPYFRVYSNAYFQNLENASTEEGVFCHGERVMGVDQVLTLQNLYNSYAIKKGLVTAFVNGYYVNTLDLFSVKVGDVVEFIYDSSFYKTVTFNVSDLNNFVSQLDNKQKFLLHYIGQDDGTIDYQDDLDIYILNPGMSNSFHGVYYHRNSVDACRMVTHRDYSIAVPYFSSISDQLQVLAGNQVIDRQSLQVRLNIRHSGYHRPLIFETNRIQELYKLKDSEILEAMVGTNATVPEWRVENLEKSGYTEIMRAESKDIHIGLIEKAYGYNACSMVLGDTPKKTYMYSGRPRIDVPRGLTQNSTAYEYDGNGQLLGYYNHSSGVFYLCENINCELVEMISGAGTHKPDVRFGTSVVTVPTGDNYRVYRCHQTSNGIDGDWKDVTGTDFYTVSGNTLTWSEADYNPSIMVRTDASFLAYDIDTQVSEGVIRLYLTELHNSVNGDIEEHMPVPMGELDIFLNGHSLIENVDYVVKFPEVVIVSKRFLKLPIISETQHIHIRFTGFCQSDMTRETSFEHGWVQYGVLSKNKKYDIRDDKVMRIVMNGNLYHRDSLKFSETSQDLGIIHGLNGFPYLIRDIVVPMKNETTKETYAYRKLSQTTDDSISNYLSLKIPEVVEANPSAISERYPLMSPFFSSVIFALQSDIIPTSSLTSNLTDNQIVDFCKPYERWLAFDPITEKNQFDFNYVIVHPVADYNVVSLKFHQFQFMKRVEKLYGKGLVDLSSFIMLAPAS